MRGLLALTSSPLSCSSEGRRVAARLRPDSSMTHDDDDDQDTRVTRLVSERQREFSNKLFKLGVIQISEAFSCSR